MDQKSEIRFFDHCIHTYIVNSQDVYHTEEHQMRSVEFITDGKLHPRFAAETIR